MTTIPLNGAASHRFGFRFPGSIAGKFLFTALAAILLAQTSLASDVAGTARLIRERRGHTATAIGGGKILVAGGQNMSGTLADVETFDATTGTFTVATRLLTPRAEHTATRLADGRVFLIGGRGTETLASTEFFDPSRNVFSSGPSLNSPRFGHTATLLADGRVVVIGGNAAGTAEIFDPRVGTFSALPGHLSEPRRFHAAVRLLDGSILIAGGTSRDGGTLKSAEILHADTLECDRIATSMFAARSRFTLRMLPDGKVQAIGGDTERTMELFNPAGYFSSLGHLAGTATSESAALRTPGRVAILGPGARTISDGGASVVGERGTIRPVQNLLDRIDYSLTEIPEAGVAIATGGVSSAGRYQQNAVLFESSAATVTTDQTDYVPGQTVAITGSGWLPGETVTLNIHRDTNDPPDTVLSAVADGTGNITNSDYVVQDYDLGLTFLLTATGQTSGYTAQTTFTDGNLQQVDLVPTSVTVTQGNDAVYTANVDMGGNTSSCSVTLDISTALPLGASYDFSLPNPTTATNVDFSRTLTISTTQLTPPGTYPFTVRATGSGCQGNNLATTTGTLVVTAATGACAGQASGFVCRADAGQCDVADTCDGVSPLCPADAFEPATASCTGASQGGTCDNDAADHCTGADNNCVDVFQTAAFTCRADAGQCDVAESCTGTSGACPADAFEPSTASCSGASQGGTCDNDPADHCTGASNNCVDVFQTAAFTCRGAAGICDAAEACTGTSGACPVDSKVPAGFQCRGSAGECDVAETCNGSTNDCPNDGFQPTGTSCSSDDEVCTTDQCSGASAMCGHTRISNCGSDCSTNTPPFVTTTSGSPSAPISLGGSVQVTANFTDASLFQTHTCTINWDDGSLPEDGVITEPSGTTPGSCTGFHAYSAPGVYTVAFVINDGCSTGLGKYEFVVVYDPSGGFVTGGGWINSPLGAYLADPTLVGKANFGFVSKYKKGSSVPDGETEFQFKAGDLNFHSSGYDLGSLVVSGYKAQYRGSGTINGVSGYKFVLTAYDGQAPNGGGTDRFRIKILRIVDSSVVYDNKMGSSEDIDVVPTALAGGSIVIHK